MSQNLSSAAVVIGVLRIDVVNCLSIVKGCDVIMETFGHSSIQTMHSLHARIQKVLSEGVQL